MWQWNKFLTFPRDIREKVRNKNKQGISLIEIVIATAILSVGILGLFQAFPQGIETSHEQELAVIAGQLGQEKLEELAGLSYAEITIGIIDNKIHVAESASDPLYKFTRSAASELVDQNLNTSQTDIGLKKITVTVYWPSVFGVEKSQNVVTLVSER